MRTRTAGRIGLGILASIAAVSVAYFAVAKVDVPAAPPSREVANKELEAGNFKDAYEKFGRLIADPNTDPAQVGDDLVKAVSCLHRLGRVDETDALREKAAATHPANWRLLLAAAKSYHNTGEGFGHIIAGQFYRGGRRGNDGRQVSAAERDRTRAMQLMTQALPLAVKDANKPELADFYFAFADILLDNRYTYGAWRLQYLTDLATLPDYEDANAYYYTRNNRRGAPVNEDGSPLFHKLPKTWDDAQSDGERWRWCLAQAAEADANVVARARYTFATFLQNQFDVSTMLYGYGGAHPLARGFGRDRDAEDDKPEETGPFAVSTLAEEETIARLASGTRRFKLPDEFNFIRILKEIVNDESGWGLTAADMLAQVFEDRQQYPRAAEYWRIGIERAPKQDHRRPRLEQIVGNWGMFETVRAAPAGVEPRLPFVYRNGKKVRFEAREIDVAKVIADIKTYVNSKPKELDWQLLQLDSIGYRIVQKNEQQYLKKGVAASWEVDLNPRTGHFDRRILITPPIKTPGAYYVTATMDGGNTTRVVLWIADTTIVKKSLDGGSYVFLADAVTGKPIPGAKLDFFGWQQQHVKDREYRIDTREFAEQTDADGQLLLKPDQATGRFNWFMTATTPDGRFAYHGFSGIWGGRIGNYDYQYNQTKAFAITDRPVYRPGQTVKFKFWIGQAKYDAEGKSPMAGQTVSFIITNPKGEKVLDKNFVADEFGGFDGELKLEDEATLGMYGMQCINHGDGYFRVEEYKKPEFEVKVEAPTEPVMLGEKIAATIKSNYYFGSPVSSAKAKYKVTRTTHNATWFPPGRWDWFYGPGYWWFGQDYDWFPGFGEWGCRAPRPWWWGWGREQPEVVSENEVPVGPDGTVKVEIDTAMAKAVHGDQDHRYEITAEVTDQSRRTIVGIGAVSVARKPFKVYAWVDRGFYREGDVVQAEFAAQTLDQKPVKGAGELKLMAIEYDAKLQPSERVVETWQVATDDQGRAAQKIKAARPGQYRLSYAVTDEKKHTIEGGYVFVVRDDKFDGRDFRFNDIEIVADKREYAPGDKVRLMVNTARADSTVVLFVRPSNGVYLPPKLLRMKGKSTTEEIEVTKRDMPNMFVEAFTVADGRLFEQTKELVVPPESRVVNVEVLPSAQRYKPGEKAKVKIKLTDGNGEPVVGSAVVSLYDKSVEYISGGSNVKEIREFFWKWRRNHSPRTVSSLNRASAQLLMQGEAGLAYIGRFGHLVSHLPIGELQTVAGATVAANGAMEVSESLGVPAATAAPASPAGRSGALFGAGGGDGIDRFARDKLKDGAKADDADSAQEYVNATVRKNFADTALWVAKLDVKKDGVAEVELDMPENLTTWKSRVWVMSGGTRVGQGEAEVVTSKDLIVRLQAPRFFVQKDEVVLSANVHNYLDSPKRVKVTLELEGNTLSPMKGVEVVKLVNVEPKGEARVDWRVSVASPGDATVRVHAQTDEESDAMQMSFPVYVHGMLKTESFAGAIRQSESSANVTFNVPAERIPEQSRVEIRYSPSLASAMVDALPYLVDYPYGCTEQTLNRFVPTVITQRVLISMGLDLKDIEAKRTNLNAQEIGDDPKRAEDWKRHRGDGLERNPVFDEAEVKAMVRGGVEKLVSQQCSDGGWGWFSGSGEHSWPHTTATVVHGLQVARASDAAVPAEVIKRGTDWLKHYQQKQVESLRAHDAGGAGKAHADNIDAFVYMVLTDEKHVNHPMREYLYRDRTHLSVYCVAQFGLALVQQPDQRDKLAMVLRNLSQYVVEDEENQTAYLKLPESGNYWWYWYGSDTEANAYYLKLLAATDGKGPLAPKLAKYLINNRRNASYWNSTRDTALCIEALADFIRALGEDKPDMNVAVMIDGKKLKKITINASNLFSFDNKVVLEGKDVTAGEHRIEFVRTGKGPLYFNAYVTNFTLEDPIRKAGLEIKVQRKFYRLVAVDKKIKSSGSRGQAVDQKVEAFKREPLADGDSLTSGELVEVELEIDSKNDYEYILFEDMKASGFEPVDTQSGYNGNDLNAYMELRDERVCFFARSLARGKHSVAYRLRAEIPGAFSALPTRASAMYAPELKANSDENKLGIRDIP